MVQDLNNSQNAEAPHEGIKPPASFVHLRVHSEYSVIDGIVRVKGLIAQTAELNMPAVAITDHVNFYALI